MVSSGWNDIAFVLHVCRSTLINTSVLLFPQCCINSLSPCMWWLSRHHICNSKFHPPSPAKTQGPLTGHAQTSPPKEPHGFNCQLSPLPIFQQPLYSLDPFEDKNGFRVRASRPRALTTVVRWEVVCCCGDLNTCAKWTWFLRTWLLSMLRPWLF